jgi:hypothetical protein
MSKKFTVKQIKENTYENASLSLSIPLPMGSAGNILSLQFDYTCPNCSGYGCRHGNGPCDDGDEIELTNLKQSIGEEQAQYLIDYLQRMILQIKNGN